MSPASTALRHILSGMRRPHTGAAVSSLALRVQLLQIAATFIRRHAMSSTISRSRFLALSAAAATVALCPFPAAAQTTDFPQKQITIVVPYTAGGSSDAVARLLGKQLSEQMGQPVVVDNRAGAGATLGTGLVARATPDGYTVLLADNAQTTAPSLYPQLPYDAVSSFRAAGMVGVSPAMLFSGQQTALRSVKDMVERQKTKPDGFTVGVGAGSPSHLISELFQMKSKLKLQMVPYKGASQAAIDVIGGQIDLIFTNPASAGQHVRSGKMKALGVSGNGRHPAFPDVPTFKEQGIEGMDVSYWFALLMPAGVPEPVAQKWEKELATALASPSVSHALTELGITQSDVAPSQMQRFLTDDRATWATVVKTSGMKLQ
jgi:tripartite-type tricarboxylate transporter receptor subunit TctC